MTPGQTVGPFFAVGLPWPDGPFVVPAGTTNGFWLRGRVLDGAGAPVPDALVESWQAAPDGRLDAPGFRGFGRSDTDADGFWGLHTVKPGTVAPGQAPHLAVSVFARGLLHRLPTRFYFADEAAANAVDPVLTRLSDTDRDTLLAHPSPDGYTIDIRLQGPHETVFFSF